MKSAMYRQKHDCNSCGCCRIKNLKGSVIPPPVKVDVRIITATNQNLQEKLSEVSFGKTFTTG